MFELAEQLKKVSTEKLEDAVADAINKASGAKCAVSVKSANYEAANLSVEITLRLSDSFE